MTLKRGIRFFVFFMKCNPFAVINGDCGDDSHSVSNAFDGTLSSKNSSTLHQDKEENHE